MIGKAPFPPFWFIVFLCLKLAVNLVANNWQETEE